VDVNFAIEYYKDLVHEKPLLIEEVERRFIVDLSDLPCQEYLYECPVCNTELESKDVVGFDLRNGIMCVGYECLLCRTVSKRPATTLEYSLFLESIHSKRSNHNRYFSKVR
jgi:hypothetical protein